MDSTPSAKDKAVMDMMRGHFTALRNNPAYTKAAIIVYTEANMSYITADRIATEFNTAEFQPIFFESRDNKKKGRVGIWTSSDAKEQMHEAMKRALVSNSLFYAKQFISIDEKKQKAQFEQEVANFRLERDAPAVPWGITKTFYSGKAMGKDDLCVTVQIAMYWSELRRANPEFIEYCRQHGIMN